MSNVELVVTALAAGANVAVSNIATSAVQDAYTGLKKLLRPWVRGEARNALEADETEPGVWEANLGDELATSGAAEDDEVLQAARKLLSLADPDAAARFAITVGTNNGVIGHTFAAPVTITNTVPGPPVPPATA